MAASRLEWPVWARPGEALRLGTVGCSGWNCFGLATATVLARLKASLGSLEPRSAGPQQNPEVLAVLVLVQAVCVGLQSRPLEASSADPSFS